MANRLRGFAKMLSTAKNSTCKERRMFSSGAESNAKGVYLSERMKEIYGDMDYRTLTSAQKDKIVQRHVNRELNIEFMKALSTGAAIGLAINFAFGLWPFHRKDLFWGDED
ncbi:hypothetical protein MKW94_000397 [Papaver nudicaule]|uniref:Uncharacterized protein n=1 Tax=Papaver nudicaule TaxID=74823 RepID=A0AA41S8V8_PAPNU|nr:hypothetical protein [Papaver nudicaule]